MSAVVCLLPRLFATLLTLMPLWAWAKMPGIVSVQPTEGRFVEHKGQFLVPYEDKIPGTEVTFTMVPIAGGVTQLGMLEGEEASPVEVELAPYWIGQCEVTWAEYRCYMRLCSVFERFNDRGMRTVTDENHVDAVTAPSKIYDPSFTFMSGEEPDMPAVSMSQYAAKQYTKWLSLLSGRFYRLPSEVEWEHACRAGTTTAYSFGEDSEEVDDHLWHEDNADWETQPVAQKEPNAWGLFDMHGNTYEWTLDAYEESGFADIEDPDGAGGEPPVRWPTKLYPRVLRGGSVMMPPDACRSDSRRASNDKELRSYDPNTPKSPWWFANDDAQDIGFRIVRPSVDSERAQQDRYWNADIPRIEKVASYRIEEEGRGEWGLVDPDLPAAIESLNTEP